LNETRALADWVRFEIYGLPPGGWRAAGTTAAAAAAAEEAYRVTDELPEWKNETRDLWRHHLRRVWSFLGTGPVFTRQLQRAAVGM